MSDEQTQVESTAAEPQQLFEEPTPTPPQPDTPIYEVVVSNPDRRLYISAATKEEAEVEFNALKESAGVTDESKVISFQIKK